MFSFNQHYDYSYDENLKFDPMINETYSEDVKNGIIFATSSYIICHYKKNKNCLLYQFDNLLIEDIGKNLIWQIQETLKPFDFNKSYNMEIYLKEAASILNEACNNVKSGSSDSRLNIYVDLIYNNKTTKKDVFSPNYNKSFQKGIIVSLSSFLLKSMVNNEYHENLPKNEFWNKTRNELNLITEEIELDLKRTFNSSSGNFLDFKMLSQVVESLTIFLTNRTRTRSNLEYLIDIKT